MYHAPDCEHGWRGSMAATLQTVRHVHDERVRQSIQRVLARLERRTATERFARHLWLSYSLIRTWLTPVMGDA
ncbi:MAG: hypothetical protein KatS3mg056_1355 [Chloroflexus sp.]|nr:MAG: hypothetical protein KatS3mg056_1355 [Chloroflexus sp.]